MAHNTTVEALTEVVLSGCNCSKQDEEKVEVFEVAGKTTDELKSSLKDLCIVTRNHLVENHHLKSSPAFETIVHELANQLLGELAAQKESVVLGAYSKRKSLYSFLSIQNLIASVASLNESELHAKLEHDSKTHNKVLSHFHKALLLTSRNAFDDARAQLESAALIYHGLDQTACDVSSKDLASFWSLVGVFRSLDGAYESASQAFEISSTLDADNLDTLIKYSVFTFEFDKTKAREVFKRAKEINPKSSDYHYHVAQYYSLAQNFQSALENAEKAVELDPSNSSAKFLVKQIVLETKNQEKLRSVLEDVLAESNDTDVLGLRAQFLLSSGHTEAALKIADQISSLESDNPSSFIIRGHAFCQTQQLDDSIANFEEALKLETNSEILLSLAQLKSLRSQSLEEARSYLDLIKKAILLSNKEAERQTLAGIYVATEADIEAARALGLESVASTRK
jgi:tetratricopeptide (TPR) repeat protein